LKEKILAEIKEEHELLRFWMSKDSENFDCYVERYYQIAQLKNYIMEEYTFWSYEAMDEEYDYVVYQVSEKTLDIWLQDDYNFVIAFMIEAQDNSWALFGMLNDRYFGYQFTNIFDEIAYDIKRGEMNNE
jgi:hypothetical protein